MLSFTSVKSTLEAMVYSRSASANYELSRFDNKACGPKIDTLQNIEDLPKSIKLDVITAFAFLEYPIIPVPLEA
jgi:hypothetical protein